MLADSQSQPQSIHFSNESCIDTMETVEDALQVLRGDTHAMVVNAKLHLGRTGGGEFCPCGSCLVVL